MLSTELEIADGTAIGAVNQMFLHLYIVERTFAQHA